VNLIEFMFSFGLVLLLFSISRYVGGLKERNTILQGTSEHKLSATAGSKNV
jgi:hypothetical protein